MEGGKKPKDDDKKKKYWNPLHAPCLSLPKSSQECNSQGLIWSILGKQVAFEIMD